MVNPPSGDKMMYTAQVFSDTIQGGWFLDDGWFHNADQPVLCQVCSVVWVLTGVAVVGAAVSVFAALIATSDSPYAVLDGCVLLTTAITHA